MKPLRKNSKGFGWLAIVIAIALSSIVGLIGYRSLHNDNVTQNTQKAAQSNQVTDPYVDWETATSPRAGFTIKYPASWSYSETVGTKDGVEHIVLDSAKIHLAVDSYTPENLEARGQSNMTCQDCEQTIKTTSFTVNDFGKINLDTVIYKLDNGSGNALILRQQGGTYYLPSPLKSGVVTTFRGISMQPSLESYQAESTSDFTQNSDYVTAQAILKSLAY